MSLISDIGTSVDDTFMKMMNDHTELYFNLKHDEIDTIQLGAEKLLKIKTFMSNKMKIKNIYEVSSHILIKNNIAIVNENKNKLLEDDYEITKGVAT